MKYKLLRWKSSCTEKDVEKATFRNMLLITYCITLVAAFAVLLLQFDSFKPDDFPLSFGSAKVTSVPLYILAYVCQSLVPTTITFAGSILMLQSLSSQAAAGKRCLLFVAIVVLAIVNVTQNAVQTQFFLFFSSIIAIILSILTIVLSKDAFSMELNSNIEKRKMKNEKSDCRPCS